MIDTQKILISRREIAFFYMPAAKSGKPYKLARAFNGLYRVVEVDENGLLVRPVNKPQENPIRVALNRVRYCRYQTMSFGLVVNMFRRDPLFQRSKLTYNPPVMVNVTLSAVNILVYGKDVYVLG